MNSLGAALRRTMDGLGFRLAVLLSVAILPLGLIALAQTWRVADEASRNAETALLGQTADAAQSERALVLTALSAAEALGEAVLSTGLSGPACSEVLTRYLDRTQDFAFAAFLTVDGTLACASQGEIGRDLSARPTFQKMMAEVGPLVQAVERGAVTGLSAVLVSQPVFRNGDLVGFVALSVAQGRLQLARRLNPMAGLVDLLTFNRFGEILTTVTGGEGIENRLPAGKRLTDLLVLEEQTFRGVSAEGQSRIFSVVPVIRGQVYALGSWTPDSGTRLGALEATAFLFPLLMWLATIGVSVFAVHHLVIRHVTDLRGQMRRYAIGRRETMPNVMKDAPGEIREMSQTFVNMARILARDEAELETNLKEKTVLLKEVHHRVKNNLQMISSIMNMQIRQVSEPAARRVLKNVQDRVMSLATIHRNLYQSQVLSAVRADALIGDLVNQHVAIGSQPGDGIRLSTDLAPVSIYPDQAVPLSLLVSEAVTNALKYIGRPADGPPRLTVLLREDAGRTVSFRVENTRGTPLHPAEISADAGGLGSQLITAFASQLDGTVTIEDTAELFALSFTFQMTDFVEDA